MNVTLREIHHEAELAWLYGCALDCVKLEEILTETVNKEVGKVSKGRVYYNFSKKPKDEDEE